MEQQTLISSSTDRFPAWIGRHRTWIMSLIAALALLALLSLDRDNVLAPLGSLLRKLSLLAGPILLPLLVLALGAIKFLHGEWLTAKWECLRPVKRK